MNYQRIIPEGLRTLKARKKKPECMRPKTKVTATRPLNCISRRSIQSVLRFFQYPKKNSMALDAVWYEARPLGINSLAKMMKTISEEARLSKVYTNHCVRATAITLWSNAGILNRHIMAIFGHRSEQSLVSYNSRPSTSQLHNCSQVLSRAFSSPSANNHSQPSETFRQSTSFQAKQVATKSLFSECTIQNVKIVFNGSFSESM